MVTTQPLCKNAHDKKGLILTKNAEIAALKGNAKTETLKAKLMFTKENIIAEHRQI